MEFVFLFVCCFCFEFQFVFLLFWLRQKANEMCWNTRLFSMAKLLPRSAYLIRYGITDRTSVCLSIHSSSTSNFLIAVKTSNAARPTSFWPARQDLPLNLDASQVFYNLQCYICIHKVYTHTHTHMCVFSFFTLAARCCWAQVDPFDILFSIFMSSIWATFCVGNCRRPKQKFSAIYHCRLEVSIYLTPPPRAEWSLTVFGVSISRGNYASFKRFSMGFRGKWKAKQGKQSKNWDYGEHVLWNKIIFYLYTVHL